MAQKKKADNVTIGGLVTESETVVIDYNGHVGRAPRKRGLRSQARVPHTYSPRHFWVPVDGKKGMWMYPGANVTEVELWKFYLKHDKTVAPLVKRGVLRLITALPDEESLTRDKTGLITRTKSPAGLAWIELMEKAGEGRDFVFQAIDARKPYARELDVEIEPFASHRHAQFAKSKMEKAGRTPDEPTVAF